MIVVSDDVSLKAGIAWGEKNILLFWSRKCHFIYWDFICAYNVLSYSRLLFLPFGSPASPPPVCPPNFVLLCSLFKTHWVLLVLPACAWGWGLWRLSSLSGIIPPKEMDSSPNKHQQKLAGQLGWSHTSSWDFVLGFCLTSCRPGANSHSRHEFTCAVVCRLPGPVCCKCPRLPAPRAFLAKMSILLGRRKNHKYVWK